MRWIRRAFLLVAAIGSLAGCVESTPDNPYPGSGGSLLREPTADDIANAQLTFDPDKLATLRIGASTKREVVTVLGEPAWWSTGESGYSRLGYHFHLRGGTVNTPDTVPALFVFDGKNILVDADYAESTLRVERGPFTYSYVEGRVAEKYLYLGGIVPADATRDTPAGAESVFLGAYIRAPIRIRRVIAGELSRGDLVLEFTVASPRTRPWTGYFLLSTDRFGTTRVVAWDLEPSLCKVRDDAVREPFKAILQAAKSSSTCAAVTAQGGGSTIGSRGSK